MMGIHSGDAGAAECAGAQAVRRAVIDIGTNSVRLLVADVAPGGTPERGPVRLMPVRRDLATTRLGRGVDRRGRLSAAAMNDTLDAAAAFANEARRLGAEHIAVVGTSALRDAANRDAFIDMARRRAGLEVRVLSGREEAALAFLGAVRGTAAAGAGPAAPDGGMVFVLDVGGGSTELILGTAGGAVHGAHSVDVGAVRVTELCVHSDPISLSDWALLLTAVEARLQPLWDALEAQGPPPAREARLVAVGGTATTLAAMHQRLEVYDPDRVHGHTLSRADVEAVIAVLRPLTVAQRRALPGLHPQRADIILAGAVIVLQVMAGLGARKLTVSESDLLEGVLLQGALVDPHGNPGL